MAANTIADAKVISLSIHIIQIFWQGVLSHMMLSLSLFLIVSFLNVNFMASFTFDSHHLKASAAALKISENTTSNNTTSSNGTTDSGDGEVCEDCLSNI